LHLISLNLLINTHDDNKDGDDEFYHDFDDDFDDDLKDFIRYSDLILKDHDKIKYINKKSLPDKLCILGISLDDTKFYYSYCKDGISTLCTLSFDYIHNHVLDTCKDIKYVEYPYRVYPKQKMIIKQQQYKLTIYDINYEFILLKIDINTHWRNHLNISINTIGNIICIYNNDIKNKLYDITIYKLYDKKIYNTNRFIKSKHQPNIQNNYIRQCLFHPNKHIFIIINNKYDIVIYNYTNTLLDICYQYCKNNNLKIK